MRSYFISILGLTAMQYVELSNQAFSVFTILLQLVIFGFTVAKLWYDVKYHKFKSIDKTKLQAEKEHPFLFNLLKLFKNDKSI